MKEFSFPLERSPSMKLLGILWTGSFSGQIIVGSLLVIGIYFMGSEKFNILSIFFFMGFILPISYMLHKRLVRKGKKLMKVWCDIQFENNVLSYKTGFPNTMILGWQTVKITEKNRNVIIKGSEGAGYHLRLSGNTAIRLGLWSLLTDARKSGQELADILAGELTESVLVKDQINN